MCQPGSYTDVTGHILKFCIKATIASIIPNARKVFKIHFLYFSLKTHVPEKNNVKYPKTWSGVSEYPLIPVKEIDGNCENIIDIMQNIIEVIINISLKTNLFSSLFQLFQLNLNILLEERIFY